MTDIQRQFKVIHKSIQTYLQAPTSVADFRESLRLVLPDSYGIAAGYVQGANAQRSEYCEVLIYDKPLAGNRYQIGSSNFQIEHVLLILEIVPRCDIATLRNTLMRVASVKRLVQRKKRKPAKKIAPFAERREKIPTDRLPVVIVACNEIELPTVELTAQVLFLHELIGTFTLEEQADYLYALRACLLNQALQVKRLNIS